MAQGRAPAPSQWDQTLLDINHLVEDHKNEQQNELYRGITKRHLKSRKTATVCASPSCKQKSFGAGGWKYHCFRCGEVFCKNCVKTKLRLNNLAHPDPQGHEYSVCTQCYKLAPQEIGQTRDIVTIYQQFRKHKHSKDLSASVADAQLRQKARCKLDLDAECKRLKAGFKENMTKNHFGRFMHELRTMCCTPDWQKSSLFQGDLSQGKCYNCETQFSLLKRKSDCCVCGQLVCPDCSSTDLLIYIPNEQLGTQNSEPQLTIIKIVGCPPEEPDVCLYVRVCCSCRTELQKRQVDKFYDNKLQEAMDESWSTIVQVAETAIKAKVRIEAHLPHYQELVESLQNELHVPKSGEQNRSNVQLLAKGQEDLSDYFTQLVVTIQGLKRMNPQTKSQTTILRNLTLTMCRAYHEAMMTFRDLRTQLVEVTPLDMLRCIQELVEKNTINGAYLSIRQLAYEVIHLCDKHKIEANIPEQIVAAEKVMYEDLRARVVRAGEDWQTHEDVLTKMLQIQLKDHRFIRPSRQLSKKHGAVYVRGFLLERADSVTQRIQLQMSVKCSEKSFATSKKQLEILNAYLAEQYKTL